jgi:zinc transport system substrate-binding protein
MRAVGILAALVVAAAAAGCGTANPSVRAEQRGKPVVVTALLPLAEAARRVGGNDVVVVDLTPLGRSPHGLTLTDRERGEVRDARLAIVLGKGFQPDLERSAAGRRRPTLDVLAALRLPNRPDHSAGPADPHVWLDPTLMGSVVTDIGDAIAKLVPAHAHEVRSRAHDVVVEDVRLDAEIRQGLHACSQHTIVTQHEAFGWFAHRYGLETMAFDAAEPDADPAPDPAHLAQITPLLDSGAVTTLFTEPLTPSSWIDAIGDERGIDVETLDPYEGLTQHEPSRTTTYRSVLLNDLRTLEDALDCQT